LECRRGEGFSFRQPNGTRIVKHAFRLAVLVYSGTSTHASESSSHVYMPPSSG
jgi:hypothetical protein